MSEHRTPMFVTYVHKSPGGIVLVIIFSRVSVVRTTLRAPPRRSLASLPDVIDTSRNLYVVWYSEVFARTFSSAYFGIVCCCGRPEGLDCRIERRCDTQPVLSRWTCLPLLCFFFCCSVVLLLSVGVTNVESGDFA